MRMPGKSQEWERPFLAFIYNGKPMTFPLGPPSPGLLSAKTQGPANTSGMT